MKVEQLSALLAVLPSKKFRDKVYADILACPPKPQSVKSQRVKPPVLTDVVLTEIVEIK